MEWADWDIMVNLYDHFNVIEVDHVEARHS